MCWQGSGGIPWFGWQGEELDGEDSKRRVPEAITKIAAIYPAEGYDDED